MHEKDRTWCESMHISNYNRIQSLKQDLDALQNQHDLALCNLERNLESLAQLLRTTPHA